MVERFEIFTLGLSRISSAWNKIAAEELKPFGLKGTYVVYLIALYKSTEGLTSVKLCELCDKDKAEVSRAVSALEKKGFVVRENVTGTGYRARIKLTEEGKRVTCALRERIKLAVEKRRAGTFGRRAGAFLFCVKNHRRQLKRHPSGRTLFINLPMRYQPYHRGIYGMLLNLFLR